MAKRILAFPEGFLWGTATSAYQNEGGNTNTQMYRWEQQGHFPAGVQCGEAANWWQMAEDDFALAEQMGNNALRLSIEWSRIEPVEGQWDSAAVDRYRAMLTDLHRRHIKPVVTLHHGTEPLWLVDQGGLGANETNRRFFVRYITHVVQSLGDLCDFWLTINEPNGYAVMGYLLGSYPPGEHDVVRTLQVLRNLMQAHVEAFYAIRRLQPEGQVGYCPNYRLFDPANPRSPLDRVVAGLHENWFNWAALQAEETGRFPFPLNLLLAPLAHAPGSRDYHGVNYYSRDLIRFDLAHAGELFGRRFTRPDVLHADPGLGNSFDEIYAEGLYRVLKAIHRRTRDNKPLYITENGVRDALDNRRPRAILEHLTMVHRAISEGIPVRGYLHWTLVDNFEWAEGWGGRFGLIEVDPLTQQRTPRQSASLFGEICRANAITEEIVERYAPEAVDVIFRQVTASPREYSAPLPFQSGSRQ